MFPGSPTDLPLCSSGLRDAEVAILMNIVAFISVQLPYKDQEFSFIHFCSLLLGRVASTQQILVLLAECCRSSHVVWKPRDGGSKLGFHSSPEILQHLLIYVLPKWHTNFFCVWEQTLLYSTGNRKEYWQYMNSRTLLYWLLRILSHREQTHLPVNKLTHH